MICENRESFEDWERLLLVCLELGFRHLDPQGPHTIPTLTHTEHHRGLVDAIFKGQECEVIADLLHVWTTESNLHDPAKELLGLCAGHLVGLHDLLPFSSRLRRLVVRSIEIIGHEGFEGVGVEKFVELLNHLHVTAEDIDIESRWVKLLLGTIQSPEGAQHLSHSYWELLAELAVLEPLWLGPDSVHNLQIITSSLTEAKEWSKLECWMGTIWMLWAGGIAEEDLDRSMALLFRQRPGALQKLEQWMERWSQSNRKNIPESFKGICKRAHEAAERDKFPFVLTGFLLQVSRGPYSILD